MKLFKNEELLFIGTKSKLLKDQIIDVLNGHSVNMNSFINLYQIYDGIKFPRGAMMFRSRFYDIQKGEWDKIEIEFFLTFNNICEIKEVKLEANAELHRLAQTHIPFADDGCGNTIWLDVLTGVVKVFYHEYELDRGLIDIAPSFEDFCASLENWIL